MIRRRPTSSALLLCVLLVLILFRLITDRPDPDKEILLAEGFLTVERVVDGDTLLLAGGERVRLIGIDTPEIQHHDQPSEALGEEASRFTRSLVGPGAVRLEFDRERRDQYHRLLAYVYLPDGRLLNEEVIRAGYSEARTRYPYRSDMKQRFQNAEAEARSAQQGLWADFSSD